MSADAPCETDVANGKRPAEDRASRVRQLVQHLASSSLPYEWHLSSRLAGILECHPTQQPAVIARALSMTDVMWFRGQAQVYEGLLEGLGWDRFAFREDLEILLRAMAHEAREAESLLRDLLRCARTDEAA